VLSAGTSSCEPATAQNIAKLVNGVKGIQFGVLVVSYTVSGDNNC
jgi:hypothetical protein